ncbi:PepSY domain-containing protein [Faucicola mancuniensis]|uniref:PepSY domain-containing protein n=1 Tax=Faucicola mancuniensis TaxID=1309795 RepID=UPI0028E3D0B1|nr:PepSY domain-containing protein [uncultured Moraxella sp.]
MFNKKIAIASLMALPMMFASVAHADYDDEIEYKILRDANYPAIKQKAIKQLQAKGYRVLDIDADDYHGKPSLSIEAVKNHQEYDIELSYPDLKVLKEKLDN